jgi:hypothetical protein
MGDFQMLVEPAKVVVTQMYQFMLNGLLILFILVVGWLISRVVKEAIKRLCGSLKLNDLSKRVGIESLLAKGGLNYTLTDLIAVIFYWVGLLITVVVAMNAVNLTVAADLLNRIVLYIPNIIVAIFILIFGMFMATVLRNIVKTAATNSGLSHGNLLAKIVEVVVIVFAVMIALEQLNIASRIIELVITITLGSFGLAFALAFGFGCQDVAKKTVNDIIEKLKRK